MIIFLTRYEGFVDSFIAPNLKLKLLTCVEQYKIHVYHRCISNYSRGISFFTQFHIDRLSSLNTDYVHDCDNAFPLRSLVFGLNNISLLSLFSPLSPT